MHDYIGSEKRECIFKTDAEKKNETLNGDYGDLSQHIADLTPHLFSRLHTT
jgi:hypothetical protein